MARALIAALAVLMMFGGFAPADANGLRSALPPPSPARTLDTAAAMAGLEGEACDGEDYGRYSTIVCKVEAACGCQNTVCELDWCTEYIHQKKKDFGACMLMGCR